ncbi:MAG: hypothetical protein RL199_2080, partial [Pseudomonadota bacterium]
MSLPTVRPVPPSTASQTTQLRQPPPPSLTSGGRPSIIMTDNVAEVVDDCIAVLPADETIFQRDATLVRVVLPADPSAAARIVPLTKASARAVLQQLAEFRVVMAAGTACKPLKPDVIDALLERGVYPGIPVIDRIVETPLVTKDLDVVSADGFHEP